MKELIEILHNEGLTLVIKSSDNIVNRFTQRGVKDLLTLVSKHPEVLNGALIADKAVGKAAAACMVVGGVRQVYADVMSESALTLLRAHGVVAEYDQLVHHIINRDGTCWCPMEKLSRNLNDPAAIIERIKDFFQSR
jgi:iron complex outermembrane receptor protein